jgi:hypothetical protein
MRRKVDIFFLILEELRPPTRIHRGKTISLTAGSLRAEFN